jgi:Flp pilus assembly protein TadG
MTRAAGRRDRGNVMVEFGAILPIALFIILICFEALMVSLTVERVENAARTGARVASTERRANACRGAAMGAMPSWLNDKRVSYGGSSFTGYQCTVRADVPLLWPRIPLDVTVERTVHMPVG